MMIHTLIRRRACAAAVAAAGTVLLAACAGAVGHEPVDVPTLDAATAGVPSDAASTTPAATASASSTAGAGAAGDAAVATDPQTEGRFGDWLEYGSGLAVKVSAPVAFTPSAWVQVSPGHPMRLTVTVRNRTGELWNPSQVHVRLRSGTTRAVQIFDYDKGVVARPEKRVHAGRKVTFSVGYWVTDAASVVVEVDPGFGYETSVFSG